MAVINLKYRSSAARWSRIEGCPHSGHSRPRARAREIKVRAFDRQGERIELVRTTFQRHPARNRSSWRAVLRPDAVARIADLPRRVLPPLDEGLEVRGQRSEAGDSQSNEHSCDGRRRHRPGNCPGFCRPETRWWCPRAIRAQLDTPARDSHARCPAVVFPPISETKTAVSRAFSELRETTATLDVLRTTPASRRFADKTETDVGAR